MQEVHFIAVQPKIQDTPTDPAWSKALELELVSSRRDSPQEIGGWAQVKREHRGGEKQADASRNCNIINAQNLCLIELNEILGIF